MHFFVLLSLCIASVGCHPPGRASQKENCYEQEKILYEPENKCYKLLTKGPCSRGQWFVLGKPKDSRIRIEGKCVKEMCKDGEYYWAETKSCVKPQDTLCSGKANEELRNNLFGEGECSCVSDPPSVRLRNMRDNPCHALYTRGPCELGMVLGFNNISSDEPTCVSDPCHSLSVALKQSGELSLDAVLAPWTNDRCYELGTEGPCSDGEIFKVHSKHLRPDCVSLTNSIFFIDRKCFQDQKGRCQTEIEIRNTNYHRQIIRALRIAKRSMNLKRSTKRSSTTERYTTDWIRNWG